MVKVAGHSKLLSAINERRSAVLQPLTRRWVALRTKARQEKAVARCAQARQLECYLPLLQRVRLVRRRKFVSDVPVFPGYVFLIGERDEAYDAAIAPRVCQVIEIPDQERFIYEIEQVRHALTTTSALELHPFAVKGQRCRVVRGPLIGLEGVVAERKKWSRLVLQVDIIGQSVSVEIDADLLEPVE